MFSPALPYAFLAHVVGHRIPAAPHNDPSGDGLAEQAQKRLTWFMPCFLAPDPTPAAKLFNKLALIPRQLVRHARAPKRKRPRRTKRAY